MTDHSQVTERKCGYSAPWWILYGFVAVAAVFLLAEHRAHLYEYLPLLLLLACPLMHLFHGHGGHRHRGGPQQEDGNGRQSTTPHGSGGGNVR